MKQTPRILFAFLIFYLISPCSVQAQIYNMSVVQKNGKTIISWVNPNPDIRQLVIQRSRDSVQGFRSIVSMPDPTAYTNGYMDKSADSATYYYRLFAAYPGGRYFFTESKKCIAEPLPQTNIAQETQPRESNPIKGILSTTNELSPVKKETVLEKKQPPAKQQVIPAIKNNSKTNTPSIQPIKNDTTTKLNSASTPLPTRERHIERILPIPTTFVKIEGNNRMEKPFIADSSILNLYEPSGFIYANKDGNLVIVLPEPARKHFTLKVSREDGTTVFMMRNIKESELLIDRSNFFHSGWFKYELSESGKIREKNRFFIPGQIK